MRPFFINLFLSLFSAKADVRGKSLKMPKTRKVKMSRKRVFLVFLKVQGPGFSCKPNIAFFMGYPLYQGGNSLARRVDHTILFNKRIGGFGESVLVYNA